MKNMREMINLMEGVVAIPGLREESESDMQTADTVGRNQDYAEFNAGQEVATESVPAIDSCQQSNPANADEACAMESTEQSPAVMQAISAFQNAVMTYGMEPENAYDRIIQTLSDEDLAGFDAALEEIGFQAVADAEDDFENMVGGIDDMGADAEALASAGHGSDEDYGFADEFDEAFDVQNGYNDVNNASGDDYFPNGADSPVIRATGPSGARQGDNPEQKKMQIAEVHKELVYGYRNYIKESAKKK